MSMNDIIAVSSMFHQNVFLLTQLVTPKDDFKKHFQRGMFNKPNTTGFIHMSYYLLTIYNAEQFKKSVEWPVICKRSEAKYRNDIKALLNNIANDHLDIGFPPILASYLVHAGGTKFSIIMLKLSQVVLRTYINREGNFHALYAPRPGLTENITKQCLNITKAKHNHNTLASHNINIQMEEAAKTIITEAIINLSNIKAEYFERKQSLINYVSDVPVNSSIEKRLLNVDDLEVIQMWKTSILDDLHHIQKNQELLLSKKHLISVITGIILNKVKDENVLDGAILKNIDTSTFPDVLLSLDNQYFLHKLYEENKLILYNFIRLLNLVLYQLYRRIKQNPLQDLTTCLMQTKASCEDAKSVYYKLQNLLTQSKESYMETQNNFHELSCVYNENTLTGVNNVLLMPSPHIKINTTCNEVGNDYQKQIELTPVEGVHKSLFSRYERHRENNMHCISESKSNLLVSRINFDDSVPSFSNSETQSPRARMLSKMNWLSTKKTGKYSRLFSAVTKKNNREANYSTMSLPYFPKANSTAVASTAGEACNALEFSLDITAKSLLNDTINKRDTSQELFDTPEGIVQNVDDVKMCNSGADEFIHTGVLSAVNNDNLSQKARRTSISDLVERYKKILDAKTHATDFINNKIG